MEGCQALLKTCAQGTGRSRCRPGCLAQFNQRYYGVTSILRGKLGGLA